MKGLFGWTNDGQACVDTLYYLSLPGGGEGGGWVLRVLEGLALTFGGSTAAVNKIIKNRVGEKTLFDTI